MRLFGRALSYLFGKSETRVSLENPSFDINNPPDWAFDMFGARKSSAGVNVSPETALTLDTVWRGVNLVAGDLGKLNLTVRQRMAGGGWQEDRQHPARYLVRRKPNEAMTAYVFRRLIQGNAMLHGNGYAYVFRGPDFAPLELLPLSPVTTWPIRVGGEIWYLTKIGTETRKIPRHDMLHIRGFSPDGLQGYNWVAKARECLGLGLAAPMYASVFFRNNSRPGVVIVFPQTVPKKTRDEIRDSWERMQSGLENAHRTAVLDGAADIKELSCNARDSQLVQTMEFSRVQVANFLGIPPHKLGDDSRTAYNSLEQENQAYLDDGLDPWLVNWEEECWDKLLTEEEKRQDSHEFYFDRTQLERVDLANLTSHLEKGLINGWYNRDEVRERLGYNPLPDGLGQTFYGPLNMAPLGQEPDEPDTDDTPPTDEEDASNDA